MLFFYDFKLKNNVLLKPERGIENLENITAHHFLESFFFVLSLASDEYTYHIIILPYNELTHMNISLE